MEMEMEVEAAAAASFIEIVEDVAPGYLSYINANTPAFFQVGVPSIKRPFGVHLWPLFNQLVSTISGGKFVPDEFHYVEGETFMSTPFEVAVVIGLYYFIITFGQVVFKNLTAWKLNYPFQLHNLVLTTVSGVLLALLFEQIFPIVVEHGVLYSVCSPNSWYQKVVVIYYLNYLTKYLEFVDTFFLVVKKKKIIFLHAYHHGATALLCYIQLNGETSVSWVPILLNLGVHVIMYWYYFLAARGIRVWWKQWITRFQIIQFILDLIFVYSTTYTFYADKYSREWGIWIPNMGTCYGTPFAASTGCLILSSYLVLFIMFYISIYKKTPAAKKDSKKTK
ncbi:fatty acid elongase ELO3 [Cyberlindnera jadinii NRRL Y-1542]|uniref:Elongation of fatty acids protein n=1 Tax=Cyberlindnera jadinii (strain ATCC 18201 / CBS 1600 / BCRC 20928 / JCM 3617 / NBRC 0987 / NRRL Y-1542) TaxID=983966 RepID=A0A1E4RYS1_CYBJN|nr:fatty acid elongase 3 [Cyberlindnera jadinii NRRL Y-1542]ODV72417.1 fatty acid elongase 3 [Cyberlindnera jadinii NRRL Y-1542]